jgi:hypothetical protein
VPCARARALKNKNGADSATRMWREARERARRSGVKFSITPQHIKDVWPVNGRCPVFGMKMQRGHPDASPSLDRLNNAWGYEPGNIAVISRRANRVKNDATAAELERLAVWMRSHSLS